MKELLANPASLIIVCGVVALVVGLNLTLFGLLRGDQRVRAEASKWTKPLTGAPEARRRQEAQLDELHKLVQDLPPTHTGQPGSGKSPV